MNLLFNEIKNFSKNNWWIYLIFLVCISIIWYTNTGSILEITLVFLFHFLGDIFMMMMGDYYANGEKRKGSISQIISLMIFTTIGIYALIFNGKINYIISQILFGFTGLKVYFYDVKGKKCKILNYKISIILGFLVLFIYYYFNLINTFGQLLQIISFIIFSSALILNNEKIKYFLSLFSLFIMVFAGGIEIYNSFLQSNIKGVDISYTLLPFTVFVFFLKNLKKYI